MNNAEIRVEKNVRDQGPDQSQPIDDIAAQGRYRIQLTDGITVPGRVNRKIEENIRVFFLNQLVTVSVYRKCHG